MKILIVGAGISGLSIAWYLKKWLPVAEITVIEKTARVGGWIRTESIEGFLFEFGPRGFLSSGKGQKTVELVHELGLEKELLEKDPSAKTRYLLHQGKLEAFNFTYLWKKNIFSLLWHERKKRGSLGSDESIGAFFERRFNPSFVADFIDPLVRGIFGGDPYQLSIRSCFPKFYEMEKEYGSLLKGMLLSPKIRSTLYSFRQGMETLPQALYQQLVQKGVTFLFQQENPIPADHTISTLPSPEIPHLSLTTVQMGFHSPLLQKKGFGYLAPSKEEPHLLGMTFDSQLFPQQGSNTRLCLMLKGEVEEAQAHALAYHALKNHLGITQKPDVLVVRHAGNAIPQYPVNHHLTVQALSQKKEIHIGSSYFGVGINDCIAQAELTALHIKEEPKIG